MKRASSPRCPGLIDRRAMSVPWRFVLPQLAFAMLICLPMQTRAQTINDLLRIIIPPATQSPPPVYRAPPPPVYQPPPPQQPVYRAPEPVRTIPSPPPQPQVSKAEVAQMQQMLTELGYDAGPADGVAGRKTMAALNAFQQEFGLTVSASPDPQSLTTLRAVHSRSATTSVPNETPPAPEAAPAFAEAQPAAGDQPLAAGASIPPEWQAMRSGTAHFRPIEIDFHQGVPILNKDNSAHLFALIKLGMDPEGQSAECMLLPALLTTEMLRGYMDGRQASGCWNGKDEFQKADTRRAFFERYRSVLANAGPSFPFRFLLVSTSSLGQYNAKAGHFQLAGSAQLQHDLYQHLALNATQAPFRASPTLSIAQAFLWPQKNVVVDDAVGRQLVSTVQSWPWRETWNKEVKTGLRRVNIVATMEAVAMDVDVGRLVTRLHALGLYDQSLSHKAYEYPASANETALVVGDIPSKLEVPSPVVLDPMYSLLRNIELDGAATPEEQWKRLAGIVLDRDQLFYRQPEKRVPMAQNDARMPIFPDLANWVWGVKHAGAPKVSTREYERFRQWATAYIAGLPDEVELTLAIRRSTPKAQKVWALGDERIGDIAEIHEALSNEGIDPERAMIWSEAGETMVIVTPNYQKNYKGVLTWSQIPSSAYADLKRRTRLRISQIRKISASNGQQFLMMEAVPLEMAIEGKGFVRSFGFEDVAALDSDNIVAAQAEAKPIAGAKAALTPAMIDLMVVKALGKKMPEQYLAQIIARRWHEETTQHETGSRFFVKGARQPSHDEIKEVISQYLSWVDAVLPAVPSSVHTRSQLRMGFNSNHKVISWSQFECFGGPVGVDARELEQKLNRMRRDDQLSRLLVSPDIVLRPNLHETRLHLATETSFLLSDMIQNLGKACTPPAAGAGTPETVPVFMKISDALPGPGSAMPRGYTLTGEATLKIVDIRLADRLPHYSDLLPADMAELHMSSPAGSRDHEAVMIEARLEEVVYYVGDKEIARLSPDESTSLKGIISDAQRTLERAMAMQDQPYWFDMVGIQLGMSFEQAESIIRKHMEVGHVFDGLRLREDLNSTSVLRPVTSGKLFLSADGRELIGLIDEPPAVKGKVLAAWRRVYVPPGTLPEQEITDALEAKYGKPELHQPVLPNERNVWYPTAKAGGCRMQYRHPRNRPLADTWEGVSSAIDTSMVGGTPIPNAYIPDYYWEPGNFDLGRAAECGPYMTIHPNFEASRKLRSGERTTAMDWIEQVLTDIPAYVQAYSKNQEALLAERKAAPSQGSSAIKF